MKKNGHTATKISNIPRPGCIHKPNEEEMAEKSEYVDYQRSEKVALSKQESLSGVIEGKTIDWRDKLKQIISNDSCKWFIYMNKQKDYFLGYVEEWAD